MFTLYTNNEINIVLTKKIENKYCIKHINIQNHYI